MNANEKLKIAAENASDNGADIAISMMKAGASPSDAIRIASLAASFGEIMRDKIDDISEDQFLSMFREWVKTI